MHHIIALGRLRRRRHQNTGRLARPRLARRHRPAPTSRWARRGAPPSCWVWVTTCTKFEQQRSRGRVGGASAPHGPTGRVVSSEPPRPSGGAGHFGSRGDRAGWRGDPARGPSSVAASQAFGADVVTAPRGWLWVDRCRPVVCHCRAAVCGSLRRCRMCQNDEYQRDDRVFAVNLSHFAA